jgi:hypothetical protein
MTAKIKPNAMEVPTSEMITIFKVLGEMPVKLVGDEVGTGEGYVVGVSIVVVRRVLVLDC